MQLRPICVCKAALNPEFDMFCSMLARCCFVSLVVALASTSYADIASYSNFLPVAGVPDGQFGWSEFTGSYVGPHLPNEIAVGGNASLSVSPGGLPPGSSTNLYSFMSAPTYTIDLDSLNNTEAFTSVAVQLAIGAPLTSDSFSLAGQLPDEFELTGIQTVTVPNIGDVDFFFYWAEWQGLASASDFQITVSSADQHVSLAGVKIDYFNTPTVYDISSVAVPEPASGIAVLIGLSFYVLQRRRR
jgi:hypothetical protein